MYILDVSMGIIKKVIEKNMFFGAKAELFSLALQMRKNPTEAERVMWKLLRKFRQSGFPFRRQHPIESPRAHSPLLAAESASIKNLP